MAAAAAAAAAAIAIIDATAGIIVVFVSMVVCIVFVGEGWCGAMCCGDNVNRIQGRLVPQFELKGEGRMEMDNNTMIRTAGLSSDTIEEGYFGSRLDAHYATEEDR